MRRGFADTLNRLATASGTGWAESYTYDGFGNLTDKTPTAGSPPVLHVAVNAANNQLVGYAYDVNGNMTSIPGTASFTYDVRNHITAANPSGGGTEQYSYSPDNLRVWKLSPTGAEQLEFYGAFGERLGVYPIVNFSPYGYYVFQGTINGYFAGKIVWSQQTGSNGSVFSGTGLEVAQNRLGSVAGSYPNGTYYYPYGEDTGTPLLGENFATYYRDGTTGFDYAKNRYYSPILGRFLTADPYRASGGPSDPRSWNRYAYTRGDPVNRNDSQGLCDNDPGGPIEEVECGGGGGGGSPVCPAGFYWDPTANDCEPIDCTPGSNFGAGGGGGGCPAPEPPPAPPPQPQPPCSDDLQMFNRPVKLVRPASHSYLEITTTNGTLLDTVEGAPISLGPHYPTMLVGQVDPGGTGLSGNNPSKDSRFGLTLVIPCSEAAAIIVAADSFKPVPYTGWAGLFGVNLPPGANSNTFMHWLLSTVGLSFYYPIPPPGAYGWYNSIPK